jgi:NAD(P)-dependent dehydrogenase (short-subunit alcohol dehydrogenase family)
MHYLASRVLKSDVNSIDGLILNAGIANHQYQTSAQGYELHCATNVLGHYLLTRLLLPAVGRSELKRIVSVTGDIYFLANDCTLDYQYRLGKTIAYARSKLGVLWNALTLHELRDSLGEPRICSVAVHPGVVASNLIAGFGWLKRRLMISPEMGAQTSIMAATDNRIDSGTYLHNTKGRFVFRDGDPALNISRRLEFWKECEEAISPYL